MTDLQIVYLPNCTTPFFGTLSVFDLACYGPANFSNLTSPSNFTLYGCPLSCFTSTAINTEQILTAPPVYVSLLTNSSNITYYQLTSSLFPNFVVQCPVLTNALNVDVNTALTSVLPTSTLSSSSTFIDTVDNFHSSTSSSPIISTQMNWLSSTKPSSNAK